MNCLSIIKWYLVLLGIGATAFPFCFRFFKALPGRGAAFARIAGLILIAYAYWLLCTLGLFSNRLSSLMLISLAFILASLFLYKRQWVEIREWVGLNRRYLLTLEGLFLFAFLFVLMFRFSSPEISGTEKPMEMTFINGILRSDDFPPHDSWLSGYAISYYYFGYIMSAILIMLSGVISTVGFNLMLASVFGLAAAAAFALVNDMLTVSVHDSFQRVRMRLAACVAPFFVLFAGNFEGFFEVLHAKGFFWNADGTSSFWNWLGLKELTDLPTQSSTWDPTGRSGIWWWRASRVLTDYSASGSSSEVIDEFPFFSFQLGDLHPHVIGIPFVILAIAVALNIFLFIIQRNRQGAFFISAFLDEDVTIRDTWLARWIASYDFWFTALCLGALIFINTWDFPFYFGLYCLAALLGWIHQHGWSREAVTVFFETAFPLGAACILLYSLFLMGLSSQAGGLAPSGVFSTRTVHFLIMFGLFVIPLFWWLLERTKGCSKGSKRFGRRSGFWSLIGLELLELIVFVSLIALNEHAADTSTVRLAGSAFASVQGVTDMISGVTAFVINRGFTLPTLVILFAMLAMGLTLFHHFSRQRNSFDGISVSILKDDRPDASSSPVDVFCALMILIGTVLVIFPEFFYLRDFFGTRMNTIFKFYYQAWILFALAAAYVCGDLCRRLKGASRGGFLVILICLMVCASIYPFWCTLEKASYLFRKSPDTVTLDGSAFLQRSRAADWAGIEWLQEAEDGVVLEKVGESYSTDNAASTFSGLPAVQGPANHESQWRGGYTEMGTRAEDVRRIYETRSWASAQPLLEKYQVRYVYIGSAERGAYTIQEQKFEKNLQLVFNLNGCKIYQVY